MNAATPAIGLAILLAWCAGAADAPAPGNPLQIKLKPDAARAKERAEQLGLYRRAVAGDADATQAWQALKPALRVSLLAEFAVSTGQSPARARCLRELAVLSPSEDPDGVALKALARVAVAEADGAQRELARNGLAARGDVRATHWLVHALRSDDLFARANAAETLKAIGGPKVYEVIIEHWRETWGASPRSHCFFGNVRSYVADYDISGDSYDPVVRSFLTGVCLDAKVLRVERDIYYITIREVAGGDANLPNRPDAWARWVKQERARLAKEAEEKQQAAAYALRETPASESGAR
jgi:hypothetical protein